LASARCIHIVEERDFAGARSRPATQTFARWCACRRSRLSCPWRESRPADARGGRTDPGGGATLTSRQSRRLRRREPRPVRRLCVELHRQVRMDRARLTRQFSFCDEQGGVRPHRATPPWTFRSDSTGARARSWRGQPVVP
jgi:hypothetical protein